METQGAGAVARRNLQALLSERRRSSFEVSQEIGRNRTYIDDFMRGRKDTLSSKSALAIATLLDVDPRYILGLTDLPRTGVKAQTFLEYQNSNSLERSSVDRPVLAGRKQLEDGEVPELRIAGRYPRPVIANGTRSYLLEEIVSVWRFPQEFINGTIGALSINLDIIEISPHTADTSIEFTQVGDKYVINRADNRPKHGGMFAFFQSGDVNVYMVRGGTASKIEIEVSVQSGEQFATVAIPLTPEVEVLGRVVLHIARP